MCEVLWAARGSRSVCRRLFREDPPSENRLLLLQQAAAQLRAKDREKWNFDFQSETPLPGRYQWELIRSRQTKITDYLRLRKRWKDDNHLTPYKHPKLDKTKDLKPKNDQESLKELWTADG